MKNGESRKKTGSYLEDLGKESSADLLHVKVIQSVQRGNRMPQRLAGSSCPPFGAGILIRITRTHVQAADIAFHFGGSPWITALFSLPVTPGRRQLQLRWQILRQTGNATLLQRVAVRFHPVFGWRGRGEVASAVPLLAAAGGGGRGDDHLDDVAVDRVLAGGLLAGFIGRLNHRHRGVIHRRVA